MPRLHPWPDGRAGKELAHLVRWQNGVVTRAQLNAAGVTDAMIRARIRAGRWQRVHPGVYLTRLGDLDFETKVWAAVGYAGEGATDTCCRELDVVGLITTACVRHLTAPVRLAEAANARRRLRWRRLIGDMLIEVAEGVESPLEWRYRHRVEVAHGLPGGRRQSVVVAGSSHERRDVAYENYRVVTELDGRLWHSGENAFRDAWRDNAAAARGEITLRYGSADVMGNPCAVAGQVGAVLATRGWGGQLRRCGAACSVSGAVSRRKSAAN